MSYLSYTKNLNENTTTQQISNVLRGRKFLDPEDRSQKATLVVLVAVISSLKIPKAFLLCSGVQQNFAHTFVLTFPTDLPSQIFS